MFPRTPANLDLDAAGGIDPDRLTRALSLELERIGPGQYHIHGGREPQHVDLRSPDIPRCSCGDFAFRDRVCKHLLRAMIEESDPRVLRATGELVSQMHQSLKELTKELRSTQRKLRLLSNRNLTSARKGSQQKAPLQKESPRTAREETIEREPAEAQPR